MHVLTRRAARLLAAGTIAIAGVASASPADAVVQGPGKFTVTCIAKAGPLQVTRDQEFNPQLDVPLEVFAGSTFKMKIPGGTTNLPSTQNPDGTGFVISEFKDLSTTYKVTGGTVVQGSQSSSGVATINGTPVNPPGVVQFPTADTIRPFTTGPIPPGALVTPDITVDITPGAAGSTIEFAAIGSNTTSIVPDIAILGPAIVTCDYNKLVATVNVVAPPPPGAPDAVADSATTEQGKAVAIDVLANDKPNSDGIAPEVGSLAKVTDPTNGTAVVADGKITYTPNAGYTGPDSFTYKVCITPPPATTTTAAPTTTTTVELEVIFEIEAVAAAAAPEPVCDVAAVNVTVTAAAVAAAATTTTTVAAAELPRTGNSSAPLGLIGVTFVAVGAASVAMVRRPRRAR